MKMSAALPRNVYELRDNETSAYEKWRKDIHLLICFSKEESDEGVGSTGCGGVVDLSSKPLGCKGFVCNEVRDSLRSRSC